MCVGRSPYPSTQGRYRGGGHLAWLWGGGGGQHKFCSTWGHPPGIEEGRMTAPPRDGVDKPKLTHSDLHGIHIYTNPVVRGPRAQQQTLDMNMCFAASS